MKNEQKKEWTKVVIAVLLCFIPTIFGVYMYEKLPVQIATHYNVHFEPDGYSSKALTVFGIPSLMALLEVLCYVAKFRNDYKKQTQIVKDLIIWVIPILTNFVMFWSYALALDVPFPRKKIFMLFSGFLFVILGNYMPKMKRNWIIGIRLPWTLADSDNWNYTHRLSGFIWVVGGIVSIIASIFENEIAFLIIVFAMIIVPTLISLLFYFKKNDSIKTK